MQMEMSGHGDSRWLQGELPPKQGVSAPSPCSQTGMTVSSRQPNSETPVGRKGGKLLIIQVRHIDIEFIMKLSYLDAQPV